MSSKALIWKIFEISSGDIFEHFSPKLFSKILNKCLIISELFTVYREFFDCFRRLGGFSKKLKILIETTVGAVYQISSKSFL